MASSRTSDTRTGGLPLAGVRIVDLTQVQLGPCATQALGDFGAEIVKVERLGAGDLSRSTDPFITEPCGQSAYFMALNRNKRSLAVDMSKPEGREIVLDLARQADVLVHNFRPGVVERLKLDYASLQAINPRLIYASGSGFGPEGPLVHKAGQDLLAQSMSGLANRNAGADGAPQLFPTALGDFTAGMILAQGVLMALYQRERTGQGACLHVCLLDTLLAMQQQEATQWMLRKRPVNWITQNLIDIFRTRDGAVTLVGVFRPNPLQIVCEALDIGDLTTRPEYATLAEQMKHRAALWRELGAAFARYTTAECVERLDAADILCAPVMTLDEALNQPQVAVNEILVSFEHPVHGTVRTTGNPLHFSGVEKIALHPAPTLGQHSEEVLRELGVAPERIAALRSAAVIN
ncbi:MAG: CoA transferase [Ideonella sp.]|nr:CoA transferase [Ideonella sp.]